MPTAQQIHDQVLNDPDILGMSWALENNQILALLQTADYATITDNTISKNDLILGLAPAFQAIPLASATIQAKWDWLARMVEASEQTIRLTDARVDALLTELVTDGLLTASQRDAIGQRLGTYAEHVWGADTVLSLRDIRAARELVV